MWSIKQKVEAMARLGEPIVRRIDSPCKGVPSLPQRRIALANGKYSLFGEPVQPVAARLRLAGACLKPWLRGLAHRGCQAVQNPKGVCTCICHTVTLHVRILLPILLYAYITVWPVDVGQAFTQTHHV